VPGVPTDRPLFCTDAKFNAAPLASTSELAPMPSGAVSRPSMLETFPVSAS
jgi:hypothetical protein